MKIKLITPIQKDGKTIDELVLNLDDLDGNVLIEIERDARKRGDANPNPLFSSLGCALIAAKASGQIPEDILALKIRDFQAVTTTVSNFLYEWVLPTLTASEASEEPS